MQTKLEMQDKKSKYEIKPTDAPSMSQKWNPQKMSQNVPKIKPTEVIPMMPIIPNQLPDNQPIIQKK